MALGKEKSPAKYSLYEGLLTEQQLITGEQKRFPTAM